MKFTNTNLKPLCVISELLGLSVPNVLNYTGLPVLYLIYVIILLCVLICACVQTFTYKVTFQYGADQGYLITNTVLDGLFNVLLVLGNASALCLAIFVKRRSVVQMFKRMREFDDNFHLKYGPPPYPRNMAAVCSYFEFFLAQLLFVGYAIYGDASIALTFWDASPSFVYYYCFHLTFNGYFVTITVLQVYYFAAAIDLRGRCLNVKLRNHVQQYQLVKKFEKNLLKGDQLLQNQYDFGELLKSHNELLAIYGHLSDSFGWQIFFLYLTTGTCFLRALNATLKYLFGTNQIGNGLMFGIFIFSAIVFAIYIALVSFACGKTSEQLGKINGIVQELLIGLGVHPRTTKEELLYKQLNILTRFSGDCPARFSAAGFLDVDYSALYMVCGCIAGYTVIFLQFA